jgi:hypothetical protein
LYAYKLYFIYFIPLFIQIHWLNKKIIYSSSLFIDQKIFGSRTKRVTISYKFLTDSNTLSSNTVVNSCSILVNKTVMLSESRFNYFLKSWLKLNLSSLSTNYVLYKILRILVSTLIMVFKYFILLKELRIMESFLEIAKNLSRIRLLKFFEESSGVIILVIFSMESVFVINTKSSFYDVFKHFFWFW